MAGDANKQTVVLVGHCGPDSSYLKVAIQKAYPGARVVHGDSEAELQQALGQKPALILINRLLEGGLAERTGVELIGRLKSSHPAVKMMLVSNYEDAQAAAVAAGAIPGFGKREIGTARVTRVLGEALER